MNGTGLSVCLPGASADQVVHAGKLAESFNINLWIGDPAGQAENADDSYVTAAAGAVAGATSDLRIGVFVTLSGSTTPLRVAEDIGVVDQASGGRVELGLVAPGTGASDWEARAKGLLRAWHTWPAGEHRTVAASPRPAQPWMSRLVTGGKRSAALADRLRAGLVSNFGDEPAGTDPEAIARRTVLVLAGEPGDTDVTEWLAVDPWRRIQWLRAEVDRHEAHELLVPLPNVGGERLRRDLKALGTVVGPAIRCSAHQAELLTHDAWKWLTQLQELHRSPEERRLGRNEAAEETHV